VFNQVRELKRDADYLEAAKTSEKDEKDAVVRYICNTFILWRYTTII
jgi:hypothetical protein